MPDSDDFLWPPESIDSLDDPAAAQKIQHSFDIVFAQLRRLLVQTAAGSGGTTHAILSATHTDSTVAAAVDGDLLVHASGTWRRLPVGTNGMALVVTLGAPAWTGTLPTALHSHNLLSAPHPDTTPASAVLGDMVVAQNAGAADAQKYWIAGQALDVLPTSGDPGTVKYWVAGEAFGGLVSAGAVSWQRKANGTTGYVWTAGSTGPDWQAAGGGSAGSGAAVYRAADFTISDRTPTLVTLDTAVFNDGFWTAGSRLTVPASLGGTYAVVGAAAMDSAFVGAAWTSILVNGVERARCQSAAGNVAVYVGHGQAGAILRLAAGDYVELSVEIALNVVGGTFTVKGGTTRTYLQLVKV